MSRERMQLDGVHTLIADGDRAEAGILANMLRGLGIASLEIADSGRAALDHLGRVRFDLCLCDAALPDMEAAAFVRAVRRIEPPTRFLPLLVLTGHAHAGDVGALRDAGSHFVVRKPLWPETLFDRIAWIAHSPRAFIESAAYTGPDRRFKSLGPPGGVGRRATDLSAEIGKASEPNMSQDEIDLMIRPMKIVAD